MQDDFPEIDVWYSKRLDVHTWSDHPEINKVVDTIFDSLTDDQRATFSSKSNNAGKATGRTHLKVIIVDLYVAWKTDPLLCIGVAQGNDAYKVNSRYNALHLSPKVRQVVQALWDAEFIDFKQGSHNRDNGRGSHVSRMRAAERLRDLFDPLDVELYELDLHHNKECIILNDFDVDEFGEPIKSGRGEKKSKPIEYADNPETERMRAELIAYNDLLRETHIDIPTLEDPYIERKRSDGKIQRIPINQSGKFVRRIFSRGEWDHNGRFYGGWWQQIGEDYRSQISINDLPTVEVDYQGLHVAILTAQRGVQDVVKDRYDLGEQIFPQFDLKEQRAIVKLLILTAINAKNRKATCLAFRKAQPKGSLPKKLKDVELLKLLDAFIDKNPHLEDDLCSDKGIELMFIDGQITERIIKAFVSCGKPILSIHDSYIVQTSDVDRLRDAMSQATLSIVGRDLGVDQSVLSYGDIMRMPTLEKYDHIKNHNHLLSINDTSGQYAQRLVRFMKYRRNNFPDTYWMGNFS